MKKIITILLLAIFVLAITGCTEKEAQPAPAAPVTEEDAPTVEPKPEPTTEEATGEVSLEILEEPITPEVTDPDYFEMSASEFGDTVEVKNVDTTIEGLTATLDKVHVTIRNFDVEDLKPRIVVQLIGDNNLNEIKEFHLDVFPKGYMMRKKLDMDSMNIPEAKTLKIVAVTLVDDNQALKEIATGKMEFIPIV